MGAGAEGGDELALRVGVPGDVLGRRGKGAKQGEKKQGEAKDQARGRREADIASGGSW